MSSPPPPVTLVFEDPHGNSASVVLSGPGGVKRVVVGEPGYQSGVWRVWAPPTHSDVYIGVRTILGFQKWSLHESGDWRFQWVTEERANEFTNTTVRLIEQWQQPPELGAGWTKGFTVRVRHEDLVEAPTEVTPADTVRLPVPPEGHAASIHVVVARPDQGWIELRELRPFDGFTLRDGRVLLLVASVDAVLDEQNQMVDAAISEAVRRMSEQGVDLSGDRALRMLVIGNNAEGDRFVWDGAVRPNHLP